ncbi:MAG TPA: c-type cytochrome [Casimicrobiaceae bacterium]|nr:c-type cytochrome [Casimicrobiaceae bacterium]
MKAVVLTAIALLAGTGCADRSSQADPGDAVQVASGKVIYASQCASCHGANLEGQPDWKSRKSNGKMPAPPHDDSGHTWHHPDDILFGITKFGLRPPYGPSGYQSDMPAFDRTLTDQQIWDVLAYVKSRWSPRVQQAQAQIQCEFRSKAQ